MNTLNTILLGTAIASLVALPQSAEARREGGRGGGSRHEYRERGHNFHPRWGAGRHRRHGAHWQILPRPDCYIYRGRVVCPPLRYYYR